MTQVYGRGELSEWLDSDRRGVLSYIDKVDADLLLTENVDVLVESLGARCRRDPVCLSWDLMTHSGAQETKQDRTDFLGRSGTFPAQKITFSVPLTGDHTLVEYRASERFLSVIDGDIQSDRVTFTITDLELTTDQIVAKIDQWKEQWTRLCGFANADASAHSSETERQIRARVEARRGQILALRALDASIPIPISRAPGAVSVPVPAHRRMPTLEQRRDPRRAAFVPEPVLADADYQDILRQCLSWARGLERSPGTAATMNEENLRDHLLISLNSYWQGQAAGELFNGAGKTDVLIRERDRNVFIGEAKIWRGPKCAREAIDQLLGYLVWRDTKATLLMFIRQARPAEIITRLHEAVETHPRHLLTVPGGTANERVDYQLAVDDEGRTIHLAVLPVVLPPRGK